MTDQPQPERVPLHKPDTDDRDEPRRVPITRDKPRPTSTEAPKRPAATYRIGA